MTKIVINNCYGGYGLSAKALAHYNELAGTSLKSYYRIPRDDQYLVKTVEDLGSESSDVCAQLAVIEIPDEVEWQVEEYDGLEWIAEKHRTWRASK